MEYWDGKPEKLATFFFMAEENLELANIKPELFVKGTTKWFTGQMREDWIRRRAQDPPITTLAELRDWAEKTVLPEEYVHAARVALTKVKWSGSVENTRTLFEERLKLLPRNEQDGPAVVTMFLQSLPPNLLYAVQKQNPKDLTSAFRVARVEETNLVNCFGAGWLGPSNMTVPTSQPAQQQKTPESSGNYSSQRPAWKPSGFKRDFHREYHSGSRGPDTAVKDQPKPAALNAMASRGGAKKGCYLCQEFGHRWEQCPRGDEPCFAEKKALLAECRAACDQARTRWENCLAQH